MKLVFDVKKDDVNRRKHGLSLADAEQLDLANATVVQDLRHDYGEARFRAYGRVAGRLHILAFTMRGDMVRVISYRKANRREELRYGGKP